VPQQHGVQQQMRWYAAEQKLVNYWPVKSRAVEKSTLPPPRN